MSATVYKEEADGTLRPVGRSDRSGTDAILEVLLLKIGVPLARTTFVAYDDADGRELEVRG